MESRDVGRGYAPDAPRKSGAVGDVTPTYAASASCSEASTTPMSGISTASSLSSIRACTPLGSASPPSASATSVSRDTRSEEHTSELQSLMRISYAVFCLKKKKTNKKVKQLQYK